MLLAARVAPASTVALIGHGSLVDLAIVFAALLYVVSLAKDIRPIRSLRSDLSEARAENGEKAKKIDVLTLKLAESHAETVKLTASRDFSTALADALGTFEERASERADKTLEALTAHDERERIAWAEITKALNLIAMTLGTPTEPQP